MLTKVEIRNFKTFEAVSIDLDKTVVLIGPNNSGKTSALQALALFEAGFRAWLSKRINSSASKRSGVTINRKDLIALSVPNAKLLWHDLHVRSQYEGKTKNILIEILVEGVTNGKYWQCGFEFDYANTESIYCRPLRKNVDGTEQYELPDVGVIQDIRMAFLPAMSGLASVEPRQERGRINVLIGEGQTAQVLRNLCYDVYTLDLGKWAVLRGRMKNLFGVSLNEPEYFAERGEIIMSYVDRGGVNLDLSSAGRGLQQTLLLLAYLYTNPGTVLLLDEPDAHLEILRQRQVYNMLQEISGKQKCQIIAASHSEVVLNEAIDRDTVVAFVGRPHTISKSQQILKALKKYGFEHYYQAEEKGWVLYLEGATDLAILRNWASTLRHPAEIALDAPFVHYLKSNSPGIAEDHFFALAEAYPSIKGFALFDRLDITPESKASLTEIMWQRREIENYIAEKDVLLSFIAGPEPVESDLFLHDERETRMKTMEHCIEEIAHAASLMGKPDIWSDDIKASDDFLEPLFKLYSEKLKIHVLRKTRFHEIASVMKPEQIPVEVKDKLDAIWAVAKPFEKPDTEDAQNN